MTQTPEQLIEQQVSLTVLRWSYLSAFALIIVLALLAQGLIQLCLFREIQSRQAATILSKQSVYSERIGRNIILLLVPGNHASVIAEMQSDVRQQEANLLLFNTSFGANYPSIAQIDGGHGRAIQVYQIIRTNALLMLRIVQESPVERKRDSTRLKMAASAIFYAQPEQLRNIQAAQAIIEQDTDSYIHLIQVTEVILFSLTLLILIYEGLFVLRPAIKRIIEAEQVYAAQAVPSPTVQPTE